MSSPESNARPRSADIPRTTIGAGKWWVTLGLSMLVACGDETPPGNAPRPLPPGQPDPSVLDASSWPAAPDGGPVVGLDGGLGSALDGAALSDASDDSARAADSTGPFPPAADYSKDGPYESRTLSSVGPNNGYTVYLPAELAPNGAKNPIIGWMSGGGTTHELYPLLPRLATHGFVVVAANVVPGIGDEVNLGKQIIAGIDWAIAENGRSDSSLFGKLDVTKIASMGYSMGSLATFTIASDPRLTTTVHISGGNMMPERIQNLKAPAAFICGTPGDASCGLLASECDLAAANCDLDFGAAQTPVFYANFTGGHLGILTPPLQDQIGTMATIWLRWKLMSDNTLAVRFTGPQCTYCTDKTFAKVQQKNL